MDGSGYCPNHQSDRLREWLRKRPRLEHGRAIELEGVVAVDGVLPQRGHPVVHDGRVVVSAQVVGTPHQAQLSLLHEHDLARIGLQPDLVGGREGLPLGKLLYIRAALEVPEDAALQVHHELDQRAMGCQLRRHSQRFADAGEPAQLTGTEAIQNDVEDQAIQVEVMTGTAHLHSARAWPPHTSLQPSVGLLELRWTAK